MYQSFSRDKIMEAGRLIYASVNWVIFDHITACRLFGAKPFTKMKLIISKDECFFKIPQFSNNKIDLKFPFPDVGHFFLT